MKSKTPIPKSQMKIYSVTEVLSIYRNFDEIPANQIAHAAERGIEVHRHCAAVCQGLWMPEPSEDAQGYINSFRNWFDAMVEEVISIEEELINSQLGFMGHPDMILRLKTLPGLSIIDNKTSIVLQRVWEVQLDAYEILARGKYGNEAIKRCGSLRLDPEGKTAKMEWYPHNSKGFSVFLCALMALRYFRGE